MSDTKQFILNEQEAAMCRAALVSIQENLEFSKEYNDITPEEEEELEQITALIHKLS